MKSGRKSWAWGLWAAVVALVVPIAAGGPAAASSTPHYDVTPQREKSVPVRPVSPRAVKVPAMPRWDAAAAHRTWPEAGSTDVSVRSTATRAAGLPVSLAQIPVPGRATAVSSPSTRAISAPATSVPVTRARVTVVAQQAAQRLHIDGLVLRVTRSDGGTGTGGVDVGVDYGAFRDAYGADWGTRLRLVSLPACALTTPALPACRTEQPLPSTNDAATHTVSAAVPLAPDAVVAADAGASGGGGDFSATSLTPSGQWSGGSSTGDFTWSYGIGTPQVPGGLQPSVSLAYSSQSVDGRTSSTSPQASWIGDGWDYSSGFVEESYGSCSDDAADGTPATGDQCWSDATDQITLSLNGASNTLVHDDATGTWHPQGDSGETVAVSTDTVNPDKEHRYFTVTTQDGTTYYFGRNQLPGWSDHGTTTTADDDPVTNSVWTARVYGNNAGEPCHAATFAASACNQAYRWNLDYVVDDHGNAMSYWYAPETGYYGADNATTPVPYTRGGYLTKIQYGQRAGKVYDTTGTPAAAQVWFDTAERCLSSASFDCAPAKLTSANAFHWPDVPFDQICASSGTCNNHGPAYFTTRWLAGIRTQVLVSGAYQNVDSWTLTHTFPPPMDAKDTTTPVAWLSSITRTGLDGGSVALKPITFTGKAMVNRVDGLDGYQPLARYRMNTITTESGEVLQITYTEADCHRLNTMVLPSSPDDNHLLCYPAYWTPPGQVTPQLDWFNKYLVHSVTEQDPAGAGLPVETVYTYVGDPAWHFADDPGTKAAYRTWNQWRGYGQVETRTGSYPSVVTLQRTTYFRGMDGDKTASGTRSVQLTDTAGDDKVSDKDEFAGRVFESQTFNGDGGARLVDVVSDPWESAKPTATQSRSAAGLPALTSHMVNVASERVTTTKADGKPRTVETDYSYDQDTGLPTAVDDLGDTGLTSDDRCERTWYAADAKGNLLPAPRRVQSVAVACSATPHYPADLISDDETFFDGASSNTAALTGPGDVTMVKRADSVASDGTPHYVTAIQFTDPATGNPAYDMYGRSLSETDALGRTTTTQYTPATGAAPAAVKVTQPRLPNQTQGFATTSKLDPARGLTLSTSDAAGYVTSSTYDALGRVTAVWEPGFSQSLGADPNTKYAYSLSNGTTPSTVTTQSLVDNGSATAYRTSVSIFDSLLRPREVQTATADGGRVITDTAYDDHGWTVKVNGPYYNGGAPDSTLVYAPDNQVAAETGTFYDGAGRVTASAAYFKASETWRTTTAYPGSDRTDVTPPQGGTATSTITDARGQTVELLTYHGPTPSGPADAVTYSYDAAGHQTGQKDNDGNVWSSTYDLLGRKVSQKDPDTGTTSSTYDLAGQQLTSTDTRGDTITNAYDVLGRKTAEYDTTTTAALSASNELASWTYDTLKKGLPTSSTRYDNGLAYTQKILGYDSHGWTQSTETVIPPSPDGTNPAGTYITDRTYTPTGNLHSYTDSAAGSLPSETVSYGYDAFGRPTSAGGDVGSWDYVDKLSWTEYDEPQQFTFGPSGNVVNTTYSYDEQTRRLKDQLTVTDSGRVKADGADYTYLPSGLITRISDQLETGQTDTQCFGYDYAQRLTAAWTATDACAATPSSGSAATVGGPAPYWQSWTYDATGDRRTQTDHDLTGDSADDAVSTYTDAKASGGPAHALAQVASHTPGAPVVDKNTDYTYDKAGNVSTRTTSAGTDTFTFDDEGKLTQLSRTGQSTATSYVYDADGNLLLRRDGSDSVLFLPDEEVTLKAGDSTATGVRYIAIAGMTVAVHSSAGFAYLVGDQNGTGQIEIDASTGAVTRRQYLPFGQLRTASSGWVGDRGFVDGEQDDETGLTNLGAREYDASTGRFLTPDALLSPDAPQTWNAYAYSGNDPVSSSDPSGACPADLCGIGTPKGDGSGDIITDGPVDPENPGRASCHKGKCTKGTSTSTASTKQLDNEEHAAEQKKATAHAAQEAAKKVKQSLTHQLLNLIGAVIGVDDAIDCITKGSAMGCISTLANFVPWTKVFKAIRVAGKALKIARALDKALVALKDATMLERDAEDALAAVRSERELAKFDREVDLADELPPQPAESAGCPVHSFLADTPVRLAGGGAKPIAKVKAGDTVLATDPQTGVTKPEKVQRVIVTHTDRDFTDLAVHSDRQPNAPPQKLTTTWHHPFWDVTHHRWTDARDLTAGTVLRQPDGTTATVTAVHNYHRRATTYDLTVTDLHSYYVLAGATPVLVHNCGERIYVAGGKHGRVARSSSRGENSAEPADGQGALDNSAQIKATSPRRVGVDPSNGDRVILDRTEEVPCGCTVEGGTNEVFHGHVRTDINSDPAMQQARNALRRALKSGEVEEP